VIKSGRDEITVTVDRRLGDMSLPCRDVIVKTVEGVSDALVRHVDAGLAIEQLEVVESATKSTAELLLRTLKAEDDAGLRKRVDAHRVAPIERAAKMVFGQLMHDAYSQDISDAQLSDRAQLAIDAFSVVLSGDRRQLESAIEIFDASDAEDDEAVDLEQARARARIRMQAVLRKVLSESFKQDQLIPYFRSRQRLQQLRSDGKLFGVKTPYERAFVYPAWQFDDAYQPLAIMPELIATAKEVGLTPLAFHQVVTGRREGGKTGVELLSTGREEAVLGLLRATDRESKVASEKEPLSDEH
jgi:hypothetical protein